MLTFPNTQNSNIVGLFSILNKGDPENQMVYYQVSSLFCAEALGLEATTLFLGGYWDIYRT